MLRRLLSRLVLASLGVPAALVFFQGCSASSNPGEPADAGDEGPVCPDIVQAVTCPVPTPSYTTEILPLVEKYCYGCHGPGGVEQSTIDFSTRQGIAMAGPTLGYELQNCLMPLPDAGAQPTVAEREAIIDWALTCGAPNN